MPVHHVDVNQIGAATLDRGDGRAQRREIGGENRRRNPDAHRLTSIDTGSPEEI